MPKRSRTNGKSKARAKPPKNAIYGIEGKLEIIQEHLLGVMKGSTIDSVEWVDLFHPRVLEEKKVFPKTWTQCDRERAILARKCNDIIAAVHRAIADDDAKRAADWAWSLGMMFWEMQMVETSATAKKLEKVRSALANGYARQFGDPGERVELALTEFDRQREAGAGTGAAQEAAAAAARISTRQVRTYLKLRKELSGSL